MRALLGLLCLCSFTPDDRSEGDRMSARLDRVSRYRALLSEITPARPVPTAQGLPDELATALERWTEGRRSGT